MEKLNTLLKTASKEVILQEYSEALEKSSEEDFWAEKIFPYIEALLSVLIPLRDQDLLFNPEAKKVQTLDSELFFRWADLVCLRVLYFILNESNEKEKLERVDFNTNKYEFIQLETLQDYLLLYRVDLINEDSLDFPVSNYNLHTGLLSIIKGLIP
jgi:hypothetical protein